MKRESSVLLELTGAVTDGKPVDWDSERDIHPELSDQLDQLRVVEMVAAVFREGLASTQPDVDTGDRAHPLRWGKLEIHEKIGEGAYGEVFRAHDPDLDRDVALKLLWPEDSTQRNARRFVREARHHAKVTHPNILVVHGADRFDGRVGLWTELLRGETLEACLRRQGPFSETETIEIGLELSGALAAVHAAGLVHRDVKTTNVMRKRGGKYVLMDFSSATKNTALLEEAAREPPSGTPLYMAPELFRGAAASPSSDIYALAVLLYRLVSARYPTEAERLDELRTRKLRGELTPLRDVRSDLSPGFVAAIERALSFDPQRRHPSVGVFERALAAPGQEVLPHAIRTRASRWRWVAGLSVLAATLLLAVWAGWSLLSPFEIETSIYRAERDAEVMLQSEDQLAPGQLLLLRIKGTRSMYVYVLNEDQEGNAFVLFPVPNAELRNPLASGIVHRLPGDRDGVPAYWQVTSAGGRETFLVVASRDRLHDVERELALLPRVEEAPVLRLNPRTLSAFRGVGAISPAEADVDVGTPVLPALYAQLIEEATSRRNLKLWMIQLRNPPP